MKEYGTKIYVFKKSMNETFFVLSSHRLSESTFFFDSFNLIIKSFIHLKLFFFIFSAGLHESFLLLF